MIIRSPQKKEHKFHQLSCVKLQSKKLVRADLISTHNLSSLELLNNVLTLCQVGNIHLKSLSMGKHGGKQKENHSVRVCKRAEIF